MTLEAVGIRTFYGVNEVLHGVSLQANEGEFIGIVGPNGCGKSTMLKSLYRVLEPKSGSIHLEGKELSGMSYKESAKCMGVVSQQSNSVFEFTVEDMVKMGRTPHKGPFDGYTKKDEGIVCRAMDQTNLTGLGKRRMNTLSGGERQRVILARALVQEPKVLILDEPTNHMDIRYQLELLKMVKSLGLTVIAALHDLNLAASFCDRIYVMKAGSIHTHGKPDEVLTEDLILDVYGVRAKILHDDEDHRRHIVYVP